MFLGEFIDENLKWNKHIKDIKQKVSRSFKHVLNQNILKSYISLW